jgi:hypothetical protein
MSFEFQKVFRLNRPLVYLDVDAVLAPDEVDEEQVGVMALRPFQDDWKHPSLFRYCDSPQVLLLQQKKD